MPLMPLVENDKAFHIKDYIQLKNYQWKNGIDESEIEVSKKGNSDTSKAGTKGKEKSKLKKKRIRKIMKIDFNSCSYELA